jgi:hypothetical protein
MNTTKRFFFYAVSLITLGMLAAGVSTILTLCFSLLSKQEVISQVGGRSFALETLSLSIPMLIIGGVLWVFFWRIIQKTASGNTTETGSAIRNGYLNLILLVAISTAIPAAAQFLQWLMQGCPGTQFSPGLLSMLIVTGAIWFYHYRVEEKEGQPSSVAKTLRRWYIYIISTWGLIWLSTSLVQLLYTAIAHLPVWGTGTIQGAFWDYPVCSYLTGTLLGGGIWAFHWLKLAKDDTTSTLRQVYLYLIAIFGGVTAGLTALIISLYKVFYFAFGGQANYTGSYFQFFGWTIPTILIAATIWAYHRKVAEEETEQVKDLRFSYQRLHSYLMSLIGLSTLVWGLIKLLGIPLGLLVNSLSQATVIGSSVLWKDYLSLCLALLLVATPVWLYYWNKIIKMVAAGGVEERSARTRRIYLYLILGVAIVTLAADSINIVYQVLNGLLQGTFGVNVLRNSGWSLQTIIIALPILLYHWNILKSDQRLGVETVILREKTVTVLAGEEAADLVNKIGEKLGSRMRLLYYRGQPVEQQPEFSDEEINKLISDIQAASTSKVMLVIADRRIQVLPYEEK